jgi:hypothetical protein
MSGYETGVRQSVGEDASRLPAKSLSVFYLYGTGYLISIWAIILHTQTTSLDLVDTSICHVADIIVYHKFQLL